MKTYFLQMKYYNDSYARLPDKWQSKSTLASEQNYRLVKDMRKIILRIAKNPIIIDNKTAIITHSCCIVSDRAVVIEVIISLEISIIKSD
jgi:hypothetical protein